MSVTQAYMSSEETSLFLGISARTLEKWRSTWKGPQPRCLGPAWARVGHRTIIYAVADVDAWVMQKQMQKGAA